MPILSEKIEIKIVDEEINNYKYSNIQLVQELQKPNKLTFFMHKDDLVQDENNIRYSLTKQLLGKRVELMIKTIRENKDKQIENDTLTFTGTIFNVNILKKSLLAGSVIEVTAYSPDYFLFVHPHYFSYENETLKDIVAKTIEPFEIEITNDPAHEEEIPYTVQYNETNYDFLRRLSSRYGEWLYYNGEKLVFGKIEKKDTVALALGNDVNDYHYCLNMEHLNFLHAHHNYLDYDNTNKNGCDTTNDSLHNLTDIAYDVSKNLYEKDTFQHLRGSTPEESFDETEISAKVQGLGEKAQMLICNGTTIRADLRIGSVIKMEEEYRKENGDKAKCYHDELVISKLIHTSDGVSNYENQFTAIPANCELPPYTYSDYYPKSATQRAVVMDNKDPEKMGRIRVQFLWQKEQNEEMMTPWIRIAHPYSGENKGIFFIPEIDEEVMVGFENGNAEKPYVIGALYHGAQRPESYWYDESNNNDWKTIRTRNHTIIFRDDNEGGSISIYDKDINYSLFFSMDEQLIRLYSKGNIELYAENDIVLDAKNNLVQRAKARDSNIQSGDSLTGKTVTISASGDVKIDAGAGVVTKAVTIKETASGYFGIAGKPLNIYGEDVFINGKGDVNVCTDGWMALTASGNNTLKGGAEVNIEGGTVNIN
jgi:hypothetical protein